MFWKHLIILQAQKFPFKLYIYLCSKHTYSDKEPIKDYCVFKT